MAEEVGLEGGATGRERPMLTVDVVLAAPLDDNKGKGRWRVLLIKRGRPPFRGTWALPGGFVEPHEPLQAAARRELQEETGLEPERLEQLHTYGDPGRDPRGWTVSVAHLAVAGAAEARSLRPCAASDAAAVAWFDLDDLPELAFDHAEILALARARLNASREPCS